MRKVKLLILLIILFTTLLVSPTHASIGDNVKHVGNAHSVGPFPYAGTVRIYWWALSVGVPNYLEISSPSSPTQTILTPACNREPKDECLGSAIAVDVGAGESITVKMYGDEKTGAGWTEPTGIWTCGWVGQPNDGLQHFEELETVAENNRTPIVFRQCWEDVSSSSSDNDWNDIILIYTYDNPPLMDFNFFGLKLGLKPESVDLPSMSVRVCPANSSILNYRVPYTCIYSYDPKSPYTYIGTFLSKLFPH